MSFLILQFRLSKQIKLYDDVVEENEHEVFRGAVTNFINKGYVATEYDKETETMILNWPNEIGTLPPEALQNNPQIGDFTHAATADFSAKQQKRITTNENNITKLNSELIKANENINDIKNNWFNIETSPLWKKVENNNIEIFKWYFIKISYQYSTENNFMKFYKVIKIYLNNVFNEFELLNVDSIIYNEQIQNKIILNTGMIYYNNKKKEFSGSGSSYPERGKIDLIGDIEEIYQYQGIDTPTEFIAEEGTERDYYTKIETNNLLDKKQDKLIAGENIKIDENNKISATDGSGESLWEIDPNSPNIIQPKEKRIITSNNTRIVDIADPTQPQDAINLRTLDKKLEDVKSQFPIAFQINAVSQEIPNLETENKTVAGAINEIKDKQSSGSNWKNVAISQDRETIVYELKTNTHYRIFYDVNNKRSTGLIGKYPCLISEFYWIYTDGSSFNDLWINLPHWKDTNLSHLVIVINQHKISWKNNSNDGNFWKLQELQE
ncbi:hypothetical protein [Spiroplasma endosymbiont of Amphimallon solstitiale]|uniref:hypothetical protein n=1 Tax=Spiroplasma endosymbiont of Amphimallon solstitiale TaxID=3066288 RepID=UPI00313E898A